MSRVDLRSVFAGLTVSMCCVCQMLWWGLDEMLAELFARHPLAGGFEGNSPDAFCALIGDKEYGLNKTPESIGLYGRRYTIVFRPGEIMCAVCVYH